MIRWGLLAGTAGALAVAGWRFGPALIQDLGEDESMAETAEVSVAGVQQYTCPMHPHYISIDPGGTCPICGMDLVPAASAAETPLEGMVAVAPEMVQTMGVRTVPAEVVPFGRRVRAFGTVEPDERLEHVVVSRLEGWIKELKVRAQGDSVEVGALLYRVYSPDLIAAQKDYLGTLDIGDERRMGAVRQRLLSLGMQTAAVEDLTTTRQVIESLPVYAEAGGLVSVLEVREGEYVKPGTPILQLQSYDSVWVIASIPEAQLPLIHRGMEADLVFPSAPEYQRKGSINYIYPTIDPRTRTADVRIELDNDDGLLLPGAYADIRFDVVAGSRLAVPTEAVLRDSRGAHVILSMGNGHFASRSVVTGLSMAEWTEIVDGLEEGDPIVVSGQFMLDSEANLREGLAKLQSPPGVNPDTPLSEIPVDAEALSSIDHFVDMALYFHEALTDGYRIDPFFVDPAITLGDGLMVRFPNSRLVPVIEAGQAALREAKSARSGEALSEQLHRLMWALEPWLLEGAPARYREAGLELYREIGSDRLWLQMSGPVRNPYGKGEAEVIVWPDPMAVTAERVPSPGVHPVSAPAHH